MRCKKLTAIEKKGEGKRKYAAVWRQAVPLAAGILLAGFCAVLPLQAEEETLPGSSLYMQGDESMSGNDAAQEDAPNPEQQPKNRPVITSQPEDARVEAGDCAYFNVSAVGKNLSYQWYVDKGDGAGFRKINGAGEALYRVMVFDGAMNGFAYKCRVECNSENSKGSDGDSKEQSGEEDNEEPDENYVESRAARLTIFYRIVGGARSVWVKSSGRGLVFQGSGPYSRFSGVNVDENRIGADGFNKGGSQTPFTEVTLLRSYLETLTEGEHELELVWSDGTAKTSFRIEPPAANLPADATGLGRTGADTEGSGRAAGKTSAVRDAAAAAAVENDRDKEKSSPEDRGRGGQDESAQISGNTTEASASEHTGKPSHGTAADVLSSAGIFADGQGEEMVVTRGERRTQAHTDYERSPVRLTAMAGTQNRYTRTICMAVTLISASGIVVGLLVYRLSAAKREAQTGIYESLQNRDESGVETKERNEGKK